MQRLTVEEYDMILSKLDSASENMKSVLDTMRNRYRAQDYDLVTRIRRDMGRLRFNLDSSRHSAEEQIKR